VVQINPGFLSIGWSLQDTILQTEKGDAD